MSLTTWHSDRLALAVALALAGNLPVSGWATEADVVAGGHFGAIANSRSWPASSVGVVSVALNSSARSQCTGTLVGPSLVLTAAHCLFFAGRRVAPGNVHFLAGLDRGIPAAHGIAARFVLPDSFSPLDRSAAGAAGDWALIVLEKPLALRPVPVRAVRAGDLRGLRESGGLTQIGYGRDRPYLPSIATDCSLGVGLGEAVLEFNCLTNFGYSGAAILAPVGGTPSIVAIGSRVEGDVNGRRGIACSALQFETSVAENQ